MFDLRYHWLTMAALFLALGLGILVGTGLGERGTVSQEQMRLADQLQAGLSQLRDENRTLRETGERLEARLVRAEQTVAMIARAAVRGRLGGRTVLLVLAERGEAALEREQVEDRASHRSGETHPNGETVTVSAGLTGAEAVARWRALLEEAGATVVVDRIPAGKMSPEKLEAWALRSEDSVTAVYFNPPSNVPMPDGWHGAVVWDETADPVDQTASSIGDGATVLPSHWFALRAEAAGPLAQWALVEALHRGWHGYIDASAPGEKLYERLRSLLDEEVP